jgi:hypothetical protein
MYLSHQTVTVTSVPSAQMLQPLPARLLQFLFLYSTCCEACQILIVSLISAVTVMSNSAIHFKMFLVLDR